MPELFFKSKKRFRKSPESGPQSIWNLEIGLSNVHKPKKLLLLEANNR